MLEGVKKLTSDPPTLTETPAIKTLTGSLAAIFEKYQEQAALLDPHLEELIGSLMGWVQRRVASAAADALAGKDNPWQFSAGDHAIFQLVYVLAKVRGPKTVVTKFPHDAVDVERALDALESQPEKEFSSWETRYVLLMWLSVLMLVPIDLNTLDSGEGSETAVSISDRLVAVGTKYLSDSGKTRDGAATMLARLLTRPDSVKSGITEKFLKWAVGVMDSSTDPFTPTGALTTLALIFQYGMRSELLPLAPVVAPAIMEPVPEDKVGSRNVIQRKLIIKVAQRLGLTYLPVRIASWRYSRGARSLLANVAAAQAAAGGKSQEEIAAATAAAAEAATAAAAGEAEEELAVPEEAESVIAKLFDGLRDSDTVVRWSAAKGIGRITERLPADLGDDVVGEVLALFTPGEGDGAWHGGCLALAELARRGLLLPARLPEVIPVALKALQYDELRGSHSVGAHVRDAACYLVWAFARAYDPNVMTPFVNDLAQGLIITAVFDREVNCRRAASAAFQEHVGRQGTFPDGISILTAADYHAVGNRVASFIEIAPEIARYTSYRKPLIDHLVAVKLSHWDRPIRELAADALSKLAPLDPEYIIESVLPSLIPVACKNKDEATIAERHGALCAVGTLVKALYDCNSPLPDKVAGSVRAIVPNLEKARGYLGRGGEMMRGGVCNLIAVLATTPMPLKEKTVAVYQASINENLRHPNEEISAAAVEAFRALAATCYKELTPELEESVINHYMKALRDPNPAVRRGFALALGAIPAPLARSNRFKDVFTALAQATTLEEVAEERDAEARRNAIRALVTLVKTAGFEGTPGGVVSQEDVDSLLEVFLNSLKDYETNDRGDVGSWVREASMEALRELCPAITAHNPEWISAARSGAILGAVAAQACEKIDKLRGVAGSVFLSLLRHETSPLPSVPHSEELLVIFPAESHDVDWTAATASFPYWVKMLALPTYANVVLLGLTVAVGGLAGSIANASWSAMHDYIRSLPKLTKEYLEAGKENGGNPAPAGSLIALAEGLIAVPALTESSDRIAASYLRMMKKITDTMVLESLDCEYHKFAESMYDIVKGMLKGTKDMVRLMFGVEVYSALLVYNGPLRRKVQSSMLILLGHRAARVRRSSADALYTRLLTHEHVVPEGVYHVVESVLMSTAWDGQLEEAKAQRAKLYAALDIPPPVALNKSASGGGPKSGAPGAPGAPGGGAGGPGAKDEFSSYNSLVKETGY